MSNSLNSKWPIHTHADTKEKPYKCHCGKTFTRQDLLKRHTRLAHTSVTGLRTQCMSQGSESSGNAGTDHEQTFSLTADNAFVSGVLAESSTGPTDFAFRDTALGLGSFPDLPIIQDFGMFADTMGFMGVDLVEPADSGRFLHYGVHMNFTDARATLDASHSSAPHVDRMFSSHRCQVIANLLFFR